MPFAKGNTLWKDGVEAKKERKEKISEFFDIAGSNGIQRYADFLDILARKEKLSPEQLQFCDRFEKLFPYMKARKTDITSDGKELNQVLVKFIDGENN